MVYCCIPSCNTISGKCDPKITFHSFPENHNNSAKWVQQINSVLQPKPPWFPRGKAVVCSKHFQHTDFVNNTDTLKQGIVPSIFGNATVVHMPSSRQQRSINESKKSPMILKLVKCESIENDSQIKFSDDQNIGNASLSSVDHTGSNVKNFTSNLNCENNFQNESDYPSLQNNADNTTTNSESQNHQQKKNKKVDSNDLIEISPNTFLKINPDIIKVNKKLTPSGNTILQFIMDQKLARSHAGTLFPTLVTEACALKEEKESAAMSISSSNSSSHDKIHNSEPVQHVLGHLVDTHVCQESCCDLKEIEEEMDVETIQQDTPTINELSDSNQKMNYHLFSEAAENSNEESSVLEKAPVLMTTNMPFSHCFMEKPKYLMLLKQKSRQIASLKFKLSGMQKKIEDLEDRCIVQERQLSYSFIKQLKTIRKNASKGDPSATYILEQIRCYAGNTKVHWSASTLSQCSVWCRKAPYAYEYFKKADFFKLPCLGTVKRFMKKHPELKFQKKSIDQNDDSSSDFDFDESDAENQKTNSDNEAMTGVSCETILTEDHNSLVLEAQPDCIPNLAIASTSNVTALDPQMTCISKDILDASKSVNFPIMVDGNNLELQEIVLPSGEIVQCYSSTETEAGNQYYIIPNTNNQSSVDQEYSVISSDSVILENSQMSLPQEQLIFITNSAEQVECTEAVISG